MFGNMDTFISSPQGQAVWVPFFELLKAKRYLQDGIHARCERHPDRAMVLSTPKDFDEKCPDGGCNEPCNVKMNCSVHQCPRKCHRLADHSQMDCAHRVNITCDKGHKYTIACHEQKVRCKKCLKEEEDHRRRLKRDLDIESARLQRVAEYQQELQQIQDAIHRLKITRKYEDEGDKQAQTLQQEKDELRSLQEREARRTAAQKKASEKQNLPVRKPAPKAPPAAAEPGSVREEWETSKREELASSPPLDKLMAMIGLEDVKIMFLDIKGTVDTAIRQEVLKQSGRYSCSLLGNPGTGE